jgi:nicotinate-nucleotide adenylyltransferase
MLRREGLADDGVYQGIYYHSTGCPGMEPVGRVVFLADKLDPHKARRYPYLDDLKGKAQGSLERAMLEFLTREMAALLEAGLPVHPASVEARDQLLGL